MQAQILLSATIFILGLMIGSFLNVCIYRIPIGKTVVKGRSYCPGCGSLITWYQNIPIFSYILLRGRCHHCRQHISFRYPAVEFLTGLIYLSTWLCYGYSPDSIFYLALFSILIVISFIDYDEKIIPDGLVAAILILGILHGIYKFIYWNTPWYFFILGLLAASVPLLILGLIYPDSMGGGDIKLMAAAGFLTGPKLILMALFIGALYAGLYSIVLVIKKKASRKTAIPFGPFLSAGIFTCVLFGERIWDWYLSIIL